MVTPTLEAIRYKRGELLILDQLLLPHETVYIPINGIKDGHSAIKTMQVRGAPAIAIVAALSLCIELFHKGETLADTAATLAFIEESLQYLKTSRPTAVNLFDAAQKLWKTTQAAAAQTVSPKDVINAYVDAAEQMLTDDVQDNKNIGKYGAEYILNHASPSTPLKVLTHCNTGSLATAGYGTALGIIRSLHATGRLEHAYCTETRPYNQGSRLTAYELVYDNIPATLVCDSMASALLRQEKVAAIIVGADRVAANGDTANKIGTYQLAITAKHHGALFIVAAPSTSVDLSIASGDEIPIEQRPPQEVSLVRGILPDEPQLVAKTVQVAAKGINIWNPSFDVTPASLITAIATEKGVVTKKDGESQFDMRTFLGGN
ncbi:putative translation initiation factor [Basidiobolus meristosporus CBS 931.73]|uniref:Methylthioribose-1-phosphate isomerase n=1 Tax=Basidiobolus meristosporus CBS 931.73 TaxID=1314790 RepID=A0A1Y1Z3N9_9FUNG|nr:putative translation initiation factor [Basidiobolus meristosporus CBS 931.73]|eukprot:ORY04724.1 putative translation initiation factor [Basidiobolus meristosporus CBS 931.73]